MLLSILGACQNAGEHLYVAHDTKLGIDASYNTAMTSGSIDLGYDRRFITWVPRSVEINDEDPDAKEAMSVIACSMLQVGALNILYYDESMATGRAAKNFAKSLDQARVSDDYFECFSKRRNKR
ncbi:MAG TPA: hypothetical protein VED46_08050 [Alphaproteobacteria bacterium]|nr:hypothetical protein [Alphaproteobacteria bacterium]